MWKHRPSLYRPPYTLSTENLHGRAFQPPLSQRGTLAPAFVPLMATQRSDVSESAWSSTRGRGKWRGSRRELTNRPPRPNYFLSVRIDSSRIWEEVSSLQERIFKKHGHLRPAAIPVEDLHLTLFVASFKEEDGTLERAAETLRHCGDILLKLGLSRSDSDTSPCPEPRNSPAAGSTCSKPEKGLDAEAGEVEVEVEVEDNDAFVSGAEALGVVDEGELQKLDHEVVEDSPEASGGPTSKDTKDVRSTVAGEGCARAPLELSFRGLGTFGDRILFVCLDDDKQAGKLWRLADALHQRFSDAKLLSVAAAAESDRGGKEPSRFDFKPRLTVMKTSKLKRRGVIIPPSCYESHREAIFGSHSPVAVELSSMLEREEAPEAGDGDPRPYYKCVERLVLASPIAAEPGGNLVS